MTPIWLERLLALQEKDLRKRDLNAKLAAIPQDLHEAEERKKVLTAGITSARQQYDAVLLAIKKLESEISAVEAENLRLQQQSALVRSNEEYQAMLATVARNKEIISGKEEETLALYDESVEVQKNAAEIEHSNRAAIASVDDEIAELQEFETTLKNSIAALAQERTAMLTGIPQTVIDRYQRILPRCRFAVAAADSGTCANCHMKITMQTVNELKKSGFAECDNCQAFVYYAGE